MNVQRFDQVNFNAAVKTPEGFVQDSPVIGRIGILEYRNHDGSIRREFRPPEEAFAADSLASIRGKPVTVGHLGVVRADNVSKIKPIGTVLSAGVQDGENIRADVVIYNLDTGNRELSCGYTVELDESPGEYNGVHFDAVQRNIQYNHLAIVAKGRAGSVARLNMDSEQEIEFKEDEKQMAKIKLDNGIEYDAAPEVVAAFEKMKAEKEEKEKAADAACEKAKTDAAEAKANMDKVEAERDTLKAEKAKFDEQLKAKDKEHADSLDKLVKERVSLLSVAASHKIDKADSMTDKEIKLSVIKAVRGDSADLSEKSDEYVNAAFDFCKEDTREDKMTEQRKAVGAKKADKQDEAVSSADAAQGLKQRLENAYKKEGK